MSAAEPVQEAQALEDLLVQLAVETRHMADFHKLLVDEGQLLVTAHKPQALKKLVLAKEQAAELLQRDETQRALLVTRFKGEQAQPNKTHLTEDLDALALHHPELAQAWQALRDQARSAKELNMRNGRMLNVHVKHVQGALSNIRLQRNRSMLYDARGRTRRLD